MQPIPSEGGVGRPRPPRSHELESAPRPHDLEMARLGLGSGGSRAQSFHVPRHTQAPEPQRRDWRPWQEYVAHQTYVDSFSSS